MRSTRQFSITLPNDMADAVQAKVSAGEYATESEVIRDGLRTLLARDRPSRTGFAATWQRPATHSRPTRLKPSARPPYERGWLRCTGIPRPRDEVVQRRLRAASGRPAAGAVPLHRRACFAVDGRALHERDRGLLRGTRHLSTPRSTSRCNRRGGGNSVRCSGQGRVSPRVNAPDTAYPPGRATAVASNSSTPQPAFVAIIGELALAKYQVPK